MPPKNITVHRTTDRMDIMTICSTWVTSLVMRVTREPVVNRSVCWNEKVMIRANRSLRTSFPKRWAATLANTPHSTPQVPPKATNSSIRIPMDQIIAISPPNTPSSTMVAIISGCHISMAISPSMNRGASRQLSQYFFK